MVTWPMVVGVCAAVLSVAAAFCARALFLLLREVVEARRSLGVIAGLLVNIERRCRASEGAGLVVQELGHKIRTEDGRIVL